MAGTNINYVLMLMNDDHIARLESEIRYLKGLLDENGITYDSEAFVEAARREEPVEIEFPALTAEHAIQLSQSVSHQEKVKKCAIICLFAHIFVTLYPIRT